ncbi:hypothetical protein FXF50_04660 [Micromonospora sp. AP08]|uniref:hypothetical protein n=1 Tax=Micromonospora sp. AP08 TaxID=2604467 RepID=UPI0011D70871|nr:hypothetical protein [Micromonospora sp. AP08]TYB39675.1 hypothetical protein FXF50_04660 [Micromonospora sp. AP08]
MIGPRLVKGGLVQVDGGTGAILRVVSLQYNPDSLARNLKLQQSAEGSDVTEALRITGPPIETLKIEAEFDATDAMEKPEQHPATVALGIHSQLAALEGLVHPRVDDLIRRDALAASGAIEILPSRGPLTLFVWSARRILPVQVTEFAVTEEAFDALLNPIRAKVSIGMRVLTAGDLGYDRRGGGIYLSYLRAKESLSTRVSRTTLNTLGIGGLP